MQSQSHWCWYKTQTNWILWNQSNYFGKKEKLFISYFVLRELRWIKRKKRFIINQSLDRSNKKINCSLKVESELKSLQRKHAEVLLARSIWNLNSICHKLASHSVAFISTSFVYTNVAGDKNRLSRNIPVGDDKNLNQFEKVNGLEGDEGEKCPSHKKAIVINAIFVSFFFVFSTLFD